MTSAAKQILALVLLWLLIFALILPANPPSFAALLVRIRRGQSLATITREADPNNHLYVTYQYVLDGRIFSGVGYGPNRNEMRVGEQVRVYYFPPRPEYATIATVEEQTKYLQSGVMAGILIATFVTLGVYWKYFRTNIRPLSQNTASPLNLT